MEFSKHNVTYIIIFIFIVVSLIHLLNIKDNHKDNYNSSSSIIENFEDEATDSSVIPSTDLVQFGVIGSSKVANNLSQIINTLTTNNIENATKLNTLSKTIINLSSNISVLESKATPLTTNKTVAADSNNIKGDLTFLNSKNTINVKDWGMVQGGRVHLNSTVDDIYLISKGTTHILKDAGWGSSGNLNVGGNIWSAGPITATNGLSMTGSGGGGVGGGITIINTDKSDLKQAYTWAIYNMNNYGKDYTGGPGKPGSGLSFWRYAKEKACAGNMCDRHMTLNDDGSSFFGGDVNVAANLTVASIWSSGNISTGSPFYSTMARNEGGQLSLLNPLKNDIAGLVNNWTLFNMTDKGPSEWKYANGLHFWKYGKDVGGPQLILFDNGTSEFRGNLNLAGGSVSIDSMQELSGPTTKTRITAQGIIFGGTNNGREANSAQISAGKHIADSLNIVGMSTGTNAATRKIHMWAEGGLTVYGSVNCSSINVGEWGIMNGNRVHIRSTVDDIYLMAKGTTHILKSPDWTASGHLNVGGDLTVSSGKINIGPDFTIVGQGSSCVLNTGVRHIDFMGNEHFNIYNKNGLAIRKGSNGTGNLEVHGNLSVDGTQDLGGPNSKTRITSQGIIFGGANNGREANSAQISAGRHIPDSLNIVGMSNTAHAQRRIHMWAEGGLTVYGAATGNSFTPFSDRRLKENIKTISENDKDKVLQLVPKTYNMIDDEKKTKRYGLIAQEVEELYPELVNTGTDGIKSMNYMELIPLLLEQIKELKKTIPNQETLNIDGAILTKSDILKLKQLIM